MMNIRKTLFKDFRINILVRLMIILLMILALAMVVILTDFWSMVFWISLAIILLIANFIRYVEKFKNHFLVFLESINQGDFSTTFQDQDKGKTDRKLYEILNELNDKFRKLRLEKESRHQYLNSLIDHINTGIISYNDKGEITLMNRAACDLLKKPYFKKVESLRHVDEKFYETILNLNTGEKYLAKLVIRNELRHISLQAMELKLEEGFEKVISMQDIKYELDEKELESWQKLVRVINHEIMNSVIPISTLANVLNQSLKEDTKDGGNEQVSVREIAEGLLVIEERSRGLASFVKATKSLTRMPKPAFARIDITGLFQRIEKLVKPELEGNGINLVIRKSGEEITINADLELIEQVLINLINNARQSYDGITSSEKKIILTASLEDKHTVIRVIDHGKGIAEKELENIFIPFYTTKKEGSGIGLPLCRQIMRLHKGIISVQPGPGKGTEVELVF